MSTAKTALALEKDDRIPPRERILAAAADLFYRHGIRAVGVEAIAEAAGTNKMTLYRHFESKDELVAEYLRRLATKAEAVWSRRAAEFAGDPLGQLRAWIKEMAAHIGASDDRGCALANAAVELPEGARVSVQCMGRDGLGARLERMGEAMIAAHQARS
jgi:AcrR family transcriptional regulator